jgi:hypothetical protein
MLTPRQFDYLAQLFASSVSFACAALATPLISALATPPYFAKWGSVIFAPVIALVFAPFWLLDATLVRPGLLQRAGWGVVIPAELAMVIADITVVRMGTLGRVASADLWIKLKGALALAVAFYGLYFAFSLLLFQWGPLKVWRE